MLSFSIFIHLANHFHFSKMVVEENCVLVFQMPVFRMNRILTTLLAEISTMLQRKHRCGFIGASSTDVLTFSLPLNHRLTWRGGRQGLGFLECVVPSQGLHKKHPIDLRWTCARLSFWPEIRKRKRPVSRSVALQASLLMLVSYPSCQSVWQLNLLFRVCLALPLIALVVCP